MTALHTSHCLLSCHCLASVTFGAAALGTSGPSVEAVLWEREPEQQAKRLLESMSKMIITPYITVCNPFLGRGETLRNFRQEREVRNVFVSPPQHLSLSEKRTPRRAAVMSH